MQDSLNLGPEKLRVRVIIPRRSRKEKYIHLRTEVDLNFSLG